MTIKLGQLLIEAGLIHKAQLHQALEAQKIYGGKLGTNLVELGFVRDADLVALLSKQLHLPAATIEEFENITEATLPWIPKEFVLRNKVVPLSVDARVKLAISDPAVLSELDSLGFRIGKSIQPVIAPEIWITAALERHYGVMRETRYISVDGSAELPAIDVVEANARAFEVPVTPTTEREVSREEYLDRLVSAASVKGVLESLMEYLGVFFPRMALFAVRGSTVQGVMLHGFAIHSRAFSQFHVQLDQSAAFSSAYGTGQPHLDALGASVGDRALIDLFGLPIDKKVAVYPIVAAGTTVAFLLGVPAAAVPVPRAGELVSSAVTKAGYALDLIHLRKKILL